MSLVGIYPNGTPAITRPSPGTKKTDRIIKTSSHYILSVKLHVDLDVGNVEYIVSFLGDLKGFTRFSHSLLCSPSMKKTKWGSDRRVESSWYERWFSRYHVNSFLMRWPFFCLWHSRLSLNGIFYKKDIYSWSFPFSDPFIWLFKRRTSVRRQTLTARFKGVPLRIVDWCLMLLLAFIVVVVFVLVKQFWTLLEEASIREW